MPQRRSRLIMLGTAFETRSRDGGGSVLRVDTGPLEVPGLFEFAQV